MSHKLLLFVSLSAFLFQVPAVAQKHSDWASEVRTAAGLILAVSPKPEDMRESLASLVRTVQEIAAQDARLPEEFRARIRHTATLLGKDPMADESNAALHEDYKALHGGKEFTFPPEIKEIGDAARLARTMIDRCLRAFDSGRPDLAAQDIVEVLLLVTTPMMSPGE